MNITKFSLPEGCDLKLKVNGVAMNIVVIYKGEEIASVVRTLIGFGNTSVRRSVLGANYVYQSSIGEVGRNSFADIRQRIRDAVDNFRSAADILSDNIRHFDMLQMNEESIARMREIAERSFQTTRARMEVLTPILHRGESLMRTFTMPNPVRTFTMPQPDMEPLNHYYRRTYLDPVTPLETTYIDNNEE